MATITTKETRAFSWAGIDRNALKVGAEISETLKNGEAVTFLVMDDGVIGLKDCLAEEHCMNKTWTNEGGWLACEMRRYLNEDVFALLPDDLQAIIKARSFGKQNDALWLFSEAEIFGEHIWGKGDEGDKQLEYFKEPANRVKCDADGDTTWWWERSPSASSSSNFCYVCSNGFASSSNASNSIGVCFGFYF